MNKKILISIAIFILFLACNKEQESGTPESRSNQDSVTKSEDNKKNESPKESKSAEDSFDIRSRFYVTVKSGLRLRKEPNLKSEIVVTIPYGSEVQIKDTYGKPDSVNGLDGAWLPTDYKNNKGYVFTSFQPKNPGFGGYVSYVNPKKEIYKSGTCTQKFNFDVSGDSQYSSLVLYKDKTYIDVESSHGNGIFPNSYGTYDNYQDVISLKTNKGEFLKELYPINGLWIEETGYELLNKDPDTFKKWEEKIAKGIQPSEEIIVLVCEMKK